MIFKTSVLKKLYLKGVPDSNFKDKNSRKFVFYKTENLKTRGTTFSFIF